MRQIFITCLLALAATLLLGSCRKSCDAAQCRGLRLEDAPSDTAALKSMMDSLRLAGDNASLCVVANKLGKTYRNVSRFADAIMAHNDAIMAAQAIHDSLLMAISLNNIGTVYRRLGMNGAAAESHYRALDYATAHKDDSVSFKKVYVKSLNGLGNIYTSMGNYPLAELYFRRAMGGEASLRSDLGLAINYANLGGIFEKRGLLDSALVYYDTSLSLNKQIGSDIGVGLCHTFLGGICEKKGDLPAALNEYETAYSIMEGTHDEWHALTPCLAMARVNIAAGADARALQYLEKARSTAERIGSLEHLADTYRLYYKLYTGRGEPAKALEAYKLADAYSDSVVSTATINEVQNVRMSLDRARQQRRIDKAELQAERERANKELGFAVFIILLIAVVAALLLVAYWLKVRTRQQRMGAEAQRVKDRFFTNVTHEFRTPLSVITSAAQDILGGGATPAEVRRDAESIIRHSHSLLTLINQLLDIAKLSKASGMAKPQWHRGDVAAFFKAVADGYVEYAARKGLTLTTKIETAEVADFVPDYAEKICANLISNAIKFTPQGGSVTLLAQKIGGCVVIHVKDTGVGMTAEQQAHVFETFYQAPVEVKAIGTGIGLSLVRLAASAMGWTVRVSSAPGSGTTFSVVIPTGSTHGLTASVSAPLPSCEADLPEEAVTPQDDEPADDDETPTVLVVEDTADVAYYVGRQLGRGYRVVYASDGDSGLAKAQELVPDVIVTDVMMPGISGLELCRKVRLSPLTSHIPVIIVTAKVTHADRLAGLEAGADAYLEKPFHADELRLRVEKLLESRKALRDKFSRMAVTHDDEKPRPDAPAPTPGVDALFVAKVGDIVRELMPKGEVDVNVVASRLCMTRHQLNRKVNALCGVSTSTLVAQVRIAKAKELLAQTDKAVGDVAMECGIAGMAYFCQLFKKHTGMTPTQFRSHGAQCGNA